MTIIKYKTVQRNDPRNVGAPQLYYAQLIGGQKYSYRELIAAMSKNIVTSPVQTLRILSHIVEYISQKVMAGHTVHIEGLGSFRPSLSSRGATTAAQVTRKSIKGLSVIFVPSASLKRQLQLAKFEKVKG